MRSRSRRWMSPHGEPTTGRAMPPSLPSETYAASDWNLRPEHPHWPLVWLTLISQLALGVSATAGSLGQRIIAAALGATGMVGALFHLGRPAVAYKALRNLRRSWLSREVLLLSVYSALAVVAVVLPALTVPAAVAGAAGVYASARLYIVPGRPAWDTPLTVVRFFGTALALGPALTGHLGVAAVGAVLSMGATAINWLRLQGNERQPWWGAARLELHWFQPWTVSRFVLGVAGTVAAIAGAPPAIVFVALAVSEAIGRWLFYVTVVPLNMPGSFWRGAAG